MDKDVAGPRPTASAAERGGHGSFVSDAASSAYWDCKDPVVVLVQDLVYAVPDKEFLPGCTSSCWVSRKQKQTLEGKKVLLDKVTAIARPGELLAIVGPSGGGKTTLLNVLAMRPPPYRVPSGCVTFNGHAETKETVKSRVNYVMAHDKLLPYLTVHESLMSAAALKLPNLSPEERARRVEQVMESMCLQSCRDTYIGGEWRKGISTGELKRVAIAVELLDEPSVLILDEPTSGLDSALSVKVIELLVREARRGRTIIATIHQPSSQIFAMFDRLLLLTTGRVVYHGPASSALEYFAGMGYECSKEWNPSDFLLDLISPQKSLEQHQSCGTEEDIMARLDQLAMQWSVSNEATAIRKEIVSTNVQLAATAPDAPVPHKRAGSIWRHEVGVLWKRTTRNSLRNPMTAIVILLIQAMQGLVIGGIFFHQSTAWAGPKPDPAISDALWNGPWFQAYNHGLPDTTPRRPLVEMFRQGVDGKHSFIVGNAGTTVDDIKGLAVKAVDKYSTCLYKAFNLPKRGYSNVTDLYEDAAKTWDDWTPRRMYSNLLGLSQIIDYKYIDAEGHDHMSLQFMEECKATSRPNLEFYMCLMKYSKPHIDVFLDCAGLPRMPEPSGGTRRRREALTSPPVPPVTVSERAPRRRALQSNTIPAGRQSKTLQDMVSQLLGPNLMQLVDAASEWATRSTSCSSEICSYVRQMYDFLVRWADGTMQTIATVLNLSGCLFFVSTILGFAAYDALLTFPQERALFNRESANGLYRASSYYVAKNVADLPFQLIPSLLMATIYYFMVGFDVTAHQLFTYFAVCILTSFCAYGFGYMVSAAAPRMEVALLTAPLTLVIWLVLAGFFLRDGDIPAWISWFKYLSFYRWSFFSFVINQFPPGKYFGTLPNKFILALSGVTETNLTLTMWVLTILGLVYRAFGYVFLATTNRRVGLEA